MLTRSFRVFIASVAAYGGISALESRGGWPDFIPFLFWSVLFSLLLGASTELAGRPLRRVGVQWFVRIAVALGVWLIALLMMRLILGGFYYAFSIPLWFPWMCGAIAGATGRAGSGLWNWRRFGVAMLTTGFLGLVGGAAFGVLSAVP